MRKITLLITIACLAAGTGSAQAGRFPDALSYRYYVSGKFAGTSSFTCEEKDKVYAFNSKSHIEIDGFVTHNLECYTEYDKETLRPIYYSYRGEKGGQKISGSIDFTETSIKGDLEYEGAAMPSSQKPQGQIILFENYVMEHHLVLLATLADADEPLNRFFLFFPSDFNQAGSQALIESEIELPVKPKPAVCRQYRIQIKSSGEFFGFFDTKSQAAVYMDYPSAATEAFLDSAYPENPATKYEPVEQ
jgi:hypothetical protein